MSVYNGEKYLREAIDSILNQTFTDFEFIIIDDGSTDESAAIINSYNDARIRLIRQENKGLAPALNVGLKAAKGKYIARMDADDISELARLQQQVSFMQEHPKYVLVGTNALEMTMEGRGLYMVNHPEDDESIRKELARTSPFHHGSVMFSRRPVDANCLYPTEVTKHIEDILFFRRLSKYGLMTNLAAPLYRYRLVPTAITNIPYSYGRKKGKLLRRVWMESDLSEKDKKFLEKISIKIIPRKRLAKYYCRVGRALLEYDHDINEARALLLKSVRMDPLQNKAWFNLMLTFMPSKWVQRWGSFRSASNGNVCRSSLQNDNNSYPRNYQKIHL